MKGLTPDQQIQLYIVAGLLLLVIVGGVLFILFYRPRNEDEEEPRTTVRPLPNSPIDGSPEPSWYRREREKIEKRSASISGSSKSILSTLEWTALLNYKPDEIPHVWVRGGTGAGKTTFVRSLLTERPGDIHIVGVKSSENWGGLPYTSDRDLLRPTLEVLLDECIDRIENGKSRGLTIVLDDYPRLARSYFDVIKSLRQLIAEDGRTARVRLILITQRKYSEGNSLSGETDLLDNFAEIELSRETHRAFLKWEDDRVELETSDVRRRAQTVTFIGRGFVISEDRLQEKVSEEKYQSGNDATVESPTLDFSDRDELVRWLAKNTLLTHLQLQTWIKGDTARTSRIISEERGGTNDTLEEVMD